MKFGQVQLVLYFDITGLCPYFQNLLTAADGDLVFGSVFVVLYEVSPTVISPDEVEGYIV